jgi:hypothetical protein
LLIKALFSTRKRHENKKVSNTNPQPSRRGPRLRRLKNLKLGSLFP